MLKHVDNSWYILINLMSLPHIATSILFYTSCMKSSSKFQRALRLQTQRQSTGGSASVHKPEACWCGPCSCEAANFSKPGEIHPNSSTCSSVWRCRSRRRQSLDAIRPERPERSSKFGAQANGNEGDDALMIWKVPATFDEHFLMIPAPPVFLAHFES